MRIADILKTKGDAVYSIAPEATLADVIDKLIACRVGSLLVLEDGGSLAGIVTERELIRTLHRHGNDWQSLRVADVMSRNVIIGSLDDSLDAVMDLMTRRRVRHLPVMDGERLAGLLSIGDIVKAALTETQFQNQLLKSYIRNWPEE
ncbi:MAG TPA: histidine kinase [Gammaproteobacteria bacterium]|nr:histidine kinase [Gammaproteobacteria bacterium]